MISKQRATTCIQFVAAALTALAVWFVKMPCYGKIYEPQIPDALKEEM